MKSKKIAIVCLITLLAVCFSFLSGCADKNEMYIQDLNDNFNGEFKFAEAVQDESSDESFLHVPGFGGYSLESVDGLTAYDIGGYPDCLDDAKVIRFETENAKYKIFGFSVGDSMTDGKVSLTGHDYTVSETLQTGVIYTLGKIRICFSGGDIINSISIILEVTNKKGVVF